MGGDGPQTDEIKMSPQGSGGTGDGGVPRHKHVVKAVAEVAKKPWWMPLALLALTTAGGFLQAKVNTANEERNASDKDIIRLNKSIEKLWQKVGPLGERVAFLEGRSYDPAPTAHALTVEDTEVTDEELEAYQQSRKK